MGKSGPSQACQSPPSMARDHHPIFTQDLDQALSLIKTQKKVGVDFDIFLVAANVNKL